MEAFFNELSIKPICASKEEAIERVNTLLRAIRELKKYGYSKLRINSNFWNENISVGYSFNSFYNDPSIGRLIKDALVSSVSSPYLQADSKEENRFILTDFSFKGINDLEVIPEGLIAAYLCQDPSLSIPSHELWKSPFLDLIVKEPDESEYIAKV